MAYFPMFVNIENQPCLVVGGGRTALRKVLTLMDFGADVTVVSAEICREIRDTGIKCREKEFSPEDINGFYLVIAATDKAEVNSMVSKICFDRKIPVNVVDRQDECSFIFPAYLRKQNVVAAFSTGGNSPVIAQYLKKSSREYLTELVGEMAECLGNIREQVKEEANPCIRRKIYSDIFAEGMETGKVPSGERIEQLIRQAEEFCCESENS